MPLDDDARIARLERRRRSARAGVHRASRGWPSLPDLTDAQLADHGRQLYDLARVAYEEWKHARGGDIPQPISVAFMAFSAAARAAVESIPSEQEDTADAGQACD